MSETITETFNIVLQKGIEGGFAPPTPNARALITRAPRSANFTIATYERPLGTPRLSPGVTRELSVTEYASSIGRLQQILRAIPVQYTGAEDLYGRNTSIVQVTDPGPGGLAELHRSGLAAGRGIRRPTEEEKALFDEAVSIIDRWGHASGPSE